MDAVSGFFNPTSTGGASPLSKILPLILAGSGIFGTVGNIQANRARNAVLSAEMNRMNAYNKLTPAQVSSGIRSLEVPLSQDLIKSITNTVSGQMAERGLSQAPGITASAIGQGLAPYQLQEQQLAQDAYFKKLGLPISAQPSPFGPFPATTNTANIWQQLLSRYMGQQLPGNVAAAAPQIPGGIQQPGLDTWLPTDPGNIDWTSLMGTPGLTGGPAPGGTQGGWG